MLERTCRVGVDTGGTFTDFVLVDPAGAILRTHKRLSTPDDPARAVVEGLAAILDTTAPKPAAAPSSGLRRGSTATIIAPVAVTHGTTVATNALLEGKGAPVAFITTAGFEDTLHIARQNRPDLYALEPHRIDPPVSRDDCIGVPERMRHDGSVITPLPDAAVAQLVDRVRQLGITSIAISLLHSYANPHHEQRIAATVREQLPGLHVTVSHELLPEMREYERAATCVANAAVAPVIVRYLSRLSDAMGDKPLRIMASHGGALPVDAICNTPVQTTLSGPAGGVLGALAMAKAAGIDRVIGFDMGGTSTDVSLCNNQVAYTTETVVGSLPVRLPMIDIHTVGAGGGSIAWIDAGGALRVGPQSAGADPGPACYGRQHGQPLATVTDAHVVLGNIPTDHPLSGDLHLDADAARSAVAAVAQRLDMGVEHAAEGILRIADATMARAIQRISVQRGHDVRDYALLPFGGAGGLHACRLAAMLGMRRVLVPMHPGLLSALGMLTAPPRYAFSHAVMTRIEPGQPVMSDALRDALDALHQRGDAALAADGVAETDRRFEMLLDLRYVGQSYELTIPLTNGTPGGSGTSVPVKPSGDTSGGTSGGTLAAFATEHDRLYGYTAPHRPIEIVAARLIALGPTPPLHIPPLAADNTGSSHLLSQQVQRDQLRSGDVLTGPRIITELSATTIVPEGWRATVHQTGQLILEPKGQP